MSIRIGQRVFSPQPWAVVVTGLLLTLFVSLGYWQLGRAREELWGAQVGRVRPERARSRR